MPLDRVLPLVTVCLDDERDYVQKAVGWVLREMGHAYPDEVRGYLEKNMTTIPALAFSRAVEHRSPEVKGELRALRNEVRRDRVRDRR